MKKGKSSKPGDFRQRMDKAAAMANAAMAKLPTTAIVGTIDTMIGVLRRRGLQIRDWDDKDKVVQKIRCIGGKVYILAPSEKPQQ